MAENSRKRWAGRRLAQQINLTCLSIFVVFSLMAYAEAADIWFSPTDPVWRLLRHWPANDFANFIRSESSWPDALRSVRVFEITKRFALESSDDDLREVIVALARHNIQMSVQATPLLSTDRCGTGIEGHGSADDMLEVAQRVKRLGGHIAYMAMDEPLWFGHVFDRKLTGVDQVKFSACHLPITEIAQQTAAKMKSVRGVFPNVVIGDDEPLGEAAMSPMEWSRSISEWIAAYREAMGEPMGFFHADVVWFQPSWRVVLVELLPLLNQKEITFGVIYNGTPQDTSDAEWVEDAERNFKTIEGSMSISPQHAIFQSWTDMPRKILPVDQVGTFANLVNRYNVWRMRTR